MAKHCASERGHSFFQRASGVRKKINPLKENEHGNDIYNLPHGTSYLDGHDYDNG